MSEEEKFESIIREIKEIYLFLTQQEPTPDDEIESREKLLNKIQSIQAIDSPSVSDNANLFEETLEQLESWDTLELWFIESELPEYLKKIINIIEELPEIELQEEYQEPPTDKLREELETASVDIDKIVNKVSKQFQEEIKDLKQEIDVLKIELEKKDEIYKQGSQMKIVKKITPKKDVKLPPPKIKIPVIGKPDKVPQIRAPVEAKSDKLKGLVELNTIKQVQQKIEEEIEKLKAPLDEESEIEQEELPQSESLGPLPKFPELKIALESTNEQKSILNILEESESSSPKPKSEIISKLPEKPPSISDILKESDESLDYTEVPKFTEMPEKPKKSTVISEIIELDTEEERIIPFTVEEPKIAKKPDITKKPVDIEKPQVIAQKPKITPVSIEEIEAESIPSTGTDLFNVFSSVGEKTTEKSSTLEESLSSIPAKEKKKKDEKKKKKEVTLKTQKVETTSFINFSSSNSNLSVPNEDESSFEEDLPSDKDSLYQELIALEGKRYSLEKYFKEIENSFATGLINDAEYNNQSNDLRVKLDNITTRINNIRRVISSL
ncbi:MAG: hypothetical protein ACFFC3_16725 [Candidatus Odinarchaeota archaeon]